MKLLLIAGILGALASSAFAAESIRASDGDNFVVVGAKGESSGMLPTSSNYNEAVGAARVMLKLKCDAYYHGKLVGNEMAKKVGYDEVFMVQMCSFR